jgi:hypothetical protein
MDPTVEVRNSVQVMGYGEPVLEGMNITFLCPSNYLLMGINNNMSMCTENGEWEPDPKDVECIGKTQKKLMPVVEGYCNESIFIFPCTTNFPRESTL